MSRCGLASNGVYMCPSCYQGGGSLLHCLSTLAGQRPAVYFCCTFLGVTSTGRYPASCPVKPGLSSSGTFRHSQPRPFILLTRCILTQFITQCPVQIHFRKWDPKAETPKKETLQKETPKTKLPNMKNGIFTGSQMSRRRLYSLRAPSVSWASTLLARTLPS